ncbi:hypothetical protein Q2941_28620 [Bradyrhizobium sp. UFLA05-153]
MRLIRKSAMLIALFPVMASNVYWGWANAYLACLFALAIGAVAGCLIKRAMIRRAHAEMRRIYGADWG